LRGTDTTFLITINNLSLVELIRDSRREVVHQMINDAKFLSKNVTVEESLFMKRDHNLLRDSIAV